MFWYKFCYIILYIKKTLKYCIEKKTLTTICARVVLLYNFSSPIILLLRYILCCVACLALLLSCLAVALRVACLACGVVV